MPDHGRGFPRGPHRGEFDHALPLSLRTRAARKGCDPSVTATLRRIPDVRAIYQMHRNLKVGPQENTEAAFIANAEEKCQGELIRLSVATDGKSYTVTVGKDGKPRRYPTRGARTE